ncbi:V-type proton ATPase subunit G1-like isoform X1 [Coffea eugenioides]|uniref:V-type proton ATPase subunit G n=1 Tax=Coffea arabica TaxID=13443 RepID=A0ABM4UTB4_COFAR|nr:V-type proton ATPase subunit G1-like isoform X1 [Coffea eugenioides]XP_027173311.1 V-type proton ATPase subunit G1-like isoform X1 [Coffea eugenioides]
MDAANRRQIVVRLLLAAEHEAQQIVNAAKTERVRKLTQAKEEAEKEVAGHHREMELEFRKNEAENSGELRAIMKRLEQETEGKINHLQMEAASVRNGIVSMLFKHATTVIT